MSRLHHCHRCHWAVTSAGDAYCDRCATAIAVACGCMLILAGLWIGITPAHPFNGQVLLGLLLIAIGVIVIVFFTEA